MYYCGFPDEIVIKAIKTCGKEDCTHCPLCLQKEDSYIRCSEVLAEYAEYMAKKAGISEFTETLTCKVGEIYKFKKRMREFSGEHFVKVKSLTSNFASYVPEKDQCILVEGLKSKTLCNVSPNDLMELDHLDLETIKNGLYE